MKKERLPLLECFISPPSDMISDNSTMTESDSPVAGSRKINAEGIDMTFNNGIGDIKGDIHHLKERIVKLEKIIERLSSFERNETGPLASKIKAVLAALNEQEIDYTYEVSISAYTEIYAYFNIQFDGSIDESAVGDVITEVFSEKPNLEYYETSNTGIYITLSY